MKYAIQDTTLTAIGDAIRDKTEKYYTVEQNDIPDAVLEFEFTQEEIFNTWTAPSTGSYNPQYSWKTSGKISECLGNKAFLTTHFKYRYFYDNDNKYAEGATTEGGEALFYYAKQASSSTSSIIDMGSLVRWKTLPYLEEDTVSFPCVPDDAQDEYVLTLSISRNDITNILSNKHRFKIEIWCIDEEQKYIMADNGGKITPLEMAEKINSLNIIPEHHLTLTGNCAYMFYRDKWNWFLKKYKIKTKDINSTEYMFAYSTYLDEIPFEINVQDKCNSLLMFYQASNLIKAPKINGTLLSGDRLFYGASKLEEIPDLYFDNSTAINASSTFEGCVELKKAPNLHNLYPNTLSNMFNKCERLRELPEDFGSDWNWEYIHSSSGVGKTVFRECYSLRNIPETFLNNFWNKQQTSNSMYNDLFNSCYGLNEVKGLGISTHMSNGNLFGSYICMGCNMLKNFTFQTNEDGTPKTANWVNQTINLAQSVGYVSGTDWLVRYNSGITADTEVTDDASYQALKDDENWWSKKLDYSRFNHDSAVNTINSLPDTVNYLTANGGGTNTIKFKGASGALTDGGAINTLTEEEIAVATAKGWTIAFV